MWSFVRRIEKEDRDSIKIEVVFKSKYKKTERENL